MTDYTISMSWSRLNSYRQCPRKFHAANIEKIIPFNDTAPAIVRGREIHKQLEEFVIYLQDPDGVEPPNLSKDAVKLKPMLENLQKKYGAMYPEKQLAITHNYEKTDWFGKPSELRWRVIADLIIFDGDKLIICDFKTGKIYPEYTEEYGQLALSSLIFMSLYPKIQTIDNSYLMVDHKKTITKVLSRADIPRLRDHFDKEFEEVNQDTKFDPKKNKYCHFCEIKKDCKYGK